MPVHTTRALLLVALAALAAGCETFAEADPTDHDPVLTTSLVFRPGVPWSLVVGRTVALGDTTRPGDAVVTDAVVTITSDEGAVLVLPHVGEGRYGAALRPFEPGEAVNPDSLFEDGPAPEAGRTYALRIVAPGFPTATATSRAPLPATVTAEAVGGWEPERPGEPGTPYSDPVVSVLITPSEPDARYAVSVTHSPSGLRGGYSPGTFYTDAPLLRQATFVEDFGGGVRRRWLSAFVDLDALGGAPFTVEVEQVRTDTVGVTVLAASPAYFEAERQAARRRSAETNPFAEPVPAYSNLDGGVGLFAGGSETRVVVVRPAGQ
jgi:hypothetical protein